MKTIEGDWKVKVEVKEVLVVIVFVAARMTYNLFDVLKFLTNHFELIRNIVTGAKKFCRVQVFQQVTDEIAEFVFVEWVLKNFGNNIFCFVQFHLLVF